MRKFAFVIFFSSAFLNSAWADFAGRVVKVQDGDTITVLLERKTVRVRLDGIDAPELGQAFGRVSRLSLAKVCAGKDAAVVDRGKDRYGRVIGGVTCAGADANAEQVRLGFAWVYRTYLPLGSPLYEMESIAKLRGVGLWRDPNPTPPWEWRRAKRAKSSKSAR